MMSYSGTNPAKKKQKKKKEEDNNNSVADEFAAVRRYLLACPAVPKDHPAVTAAIEGLDQEEKRRIRDAKLRSKFTSDNNKTACSMDVQMEDDDAVRVEPPSPPAEEEQEEKKVDGGSPSPGDDDWHEVNANAANNDQNVEDDSPSSSFLARRLGQSAVAALAAHDVKTNRPAAAVAAALHAALVSDALQFTCTGVPAPAGKNSGGFAPPVRALDPRKQLLPADWDKKANGDGSIALRYRKDGHNNAGSVLLRVQEEGATMDVSNDASAAVEIRVVFGPPGATGSTAEPTPSLSLALDEYLNLDSWNAAAKKSNGAKISPILHYKSLEGLLTRFCNTFDLGAVANDDDEAEAATTSDHPGAVPAAAQQQQYVDHAAIAMQQQHQQQQQQQQQSTMMDPLRVAVPANNYSVPSTIDSAFPGLRHPGGGPGGDFASDLLPGGNIRGPSFAGPPGGGGDYGGMLMGPNHPMFRGTGVGIGGGMGGIGGGFRGGGMGGLGMQPRYDPVGPPGGPTEPNWPYPNNPQQQRHPQQPPRGGHPPGGTGEPNDDHEPYVDVLNNNNNRRQNNNNNNNRFNDGMFL